MFGVVCARTFRSSKKSWGIRCGSCVGRASGCGRCLVANRTNSNFSTSAPIALAQRAHLVRYNVVVFTPTEAEATTASFFRTHDKADHQNVDNHPRNVQHEYLCGACYRRLAHEPARRGTQLLESRLVAANERLTKASWLIQREHLGWDHHSGSPAFRNPSSYRATSSLRR